MEQSRSYRKRVNDSLFYLLLILAMVAGLSVAAPPTTTSSEETISPFRFSTSGRAILSNAKDPQDPGAQATNLFMHENQLQGEYGEYTLGVGFANRFTTNGPKDLSSPFVLEKKALAGAWERWSFVAGDSHQELGMGIALSLYRDPVFGIDNTLEGASVRFQPPRWDVGLFGGRVNALKAPVAINPLDSPIMGREVLLAGASVKAPVAEETSVGGHYLLAMSRRLEESNFEKRWHTVGTSVGMDGIFGEVDVYAESNLLMPEGLGKQRNLSYATGYGNYGSLSWSPSPWKARLEVKDYRGYHFDLRRPPTLEEDIIVTLNTQDVTAGRVSVERTFDGISAQGNWLGGYDYEIKAPLYHGVLGTKIKLPAKTELELRGGYRWATGKSDLSHLAIKGKVPTFRGQALELGVRKQITRKNLDTTPLTEDRNIIDTTYTFSESFNASFGYEYLPTNAASAGNHFVNVGGTYKTGPVIAKGFVGQTSGGTQCSGGVCRQVPPYTGAMLETAYAF